MYHTVVQAARLLLPAVGLLLLGAPLLLRLFGADYARAGATLLRLLALAAVPHVASILYLGVARVRGEVAGIVAVEGTHAALLLGLSYPLLHRYGITGVGLAWLASRTVVALALLLTRLRTLLRPAAAQ